MTNNSNTPSEDMTVEQARLSPKSKTAGMTDQNSPDASILSIDNDSPSGKTLGSMMGEMVWLMSQSPTHKYLALADLEWALMPAILLNQYKLYREDKKPIGAALWGYLNKEAEMKLKTAGRLAPADWGNGAVLDQDKGMISQQGGTLWLVELVAPFHTEQNKHREQMLGDLMQTAFKDKSFKLMHVNPGTGQREEKVFG